MVLSIMPSRTRSIYIPKDINVLAATLTSEANERPILTSHVPYSTSSDHEPPILSPIFPTTAMHLPPTKSRTASRRYYRSDDFQNALREAHIELERNSTSSTSTASSSTSSHNDDKPGLHRSNTSASISFFVPAALRRPQTSSASTSTSDLPSSLGGAPRLSRYRSVLRLRGGASAGAGTGGSRRNRSDVMLSSLDE